MICQEVCEKREATIWLLPFMLCPEECAQRILGSGHGRYEFMMDGKTAQSSIVGILWMSLSVKMSSSSKEGEENSEMTDSVSVENQ